MIIFAHRFDGFQRRFSTPSMSKPMRTRPKRQRARDSQLHTYQGNHHHQPQSFTTADHTTADDRFASIFPADLYRSRESHPPTHDSPSRESALSFARSLVSHDVRTPIDRTISRQSTVHRRRNGSSSFNPFAAESLLSVTVCTIDRGLGLPEAVSRHSLVIARSYSAGHLQNRNDSDVRKTDAKLSTYLYIIQYRIC